MKEHRKLPKDAFEKIVETLRDRFGEENGITIDALAVAAGVTRLGADSQGNILIIPRRRVMEELLESRAADFPFLVCVSTQTGYFRPATKDEIEHWWNSMHSRIKACARRLHIGRITASRDGWAYEGAGRFSRRTPKTDLFEGVA